MPQAGNATTALLRAELTRVLAARGIELDAQGQPLKHISSVPRRDYLIPGRIDMFSTSVLTWRHGMRGDYDQNGEVNIADLTPIGMHLGKTSASADWANASAADGDGNGEVNIADVTPIGLSFKAVCDGYVVEARYSADDDWREFGFAPYSGATEDGIYRVLSYMALAGAVELEYRVAPVAPTREFDWTVYQLDTGAGECTEPAIAAINGKPALAFIDVTNGSLMYAFSSITRPLSAADWTSLVVTDLPETIAAPALIEHDGNAAIAYAASTGGEGHLFYSRALTSQPAVADWQTHFVTLCGVYQRPGLVIRDGKPVIGFGYTADGLKLAVTLLAEPMQTADWSIVQAGSGTLSTTYWPSLSFSGGVLMAAFAQPGTSAQACFSRATTASPVDFNDFVEYTVGVTGSHIDYPTLAAFGGLPCIAYSDTDTGDLRFARATSTAPDAADWVTHTPFADSFGTAYTWLRALDGKPAVSFGTDGQSFAWSTAAQPQAAADWLVSPELADRRPDASSYAVLEHLPVIAFAQDDAVTGLRITVAVAQEK